MNLHLRCAAAMLAVLFLSGGTAFGQCPATVPVQGAPPPAPLPVFPADNWWNLDIRAAPVDIGSAAFIAYINNGGTRRPHPDFGGEASAGGVDIYGMPYAIVAGTQTKRAVAFDYADESDGVDHATGLSFPFYPIPDQAITQSHWVEGGAPANVDQRAQGDRHLLMVDCSNRVLYELYNVYYDTAQAKWFAGSGASFDMTTNARRPDGWTSADAAGLAIFPGLIRYDEAANATVTDIGHAFRVTARATNGYVFPASHRAGSSAGALPMGARLRLKALVNGIDPATRNSDPVAQKIFRAMQKYGLIVADNGSDLYVTGSFDLRWNNGVLNPAFSTLSASDFEVVQLGWNPPPAIAASLSAISAVPNPVVGGNASNGTVTLTGPAPSGGASVALSSANPAAHVPATVTVAAGASTAGFSVTTTAVTVPAAGTLAASYSGSTRTVILTVSPAVAALASISLAPASLVSGQRSTATVTLSAPAPAGGASVTLAASSSVAALPSSIMVATGASTATFLIYTSPVYRVGSITITATYKSVAKSAVLTITH